MTNLATGMATSFVWPGSGSGSTQSAGESVSGNARCAHAGNSAVTGGFGDGFVLLNTAHISLHHIGSTWTGMLGHSAMVDHGANTGRWSTQSGTLTVIQGSDGSFGTKSITFTTPYNAPPFVQLYNLTNVFAFNLSSVTTGGFSSSFSGLRALVAQDRADIQWESDGTL